MSLVFTPRQVALNFMEGVAQPLRHRELTWEMTRREVGVVGRQMTRREDTPSGE